MAEKDDLKREWLDEAEAVASGMRDRYLAAVAEGQEQRKPYTAYIAGPMSGYDNYNFDAFDQVEEHVHKAGFAEMDETGLRPLAVVNPARNFDRDQTLPKRVYLALAVRQVIEADAIVLLPNWHKSEGAQLEAQIGLDLGKDFYVAYKDVSTRNEWKIFATSAEIIQACMGHADEEVYPHPDLLIRNPPPSFTNRTGTYYIEDEPGSVPPETIEEEAGRLVRHGARQETYGHPRGDFDRVGKRWTIDLAEKLKPTEVIRAEDVALMMIDFKLARLTQSPSHRDTKVDVIGYTICLDRLAEPDAVVSFISSQNEAAAELLRTRRIPTRRTGRTDSSSS